MHLSPEYIVHVGVHASRKSEKTLHVDTNETIKLTRLNDSRSFLPVLKQVSRYIPEHRIRSTHSSTVREHLQMFVGWCNVKMST